MPTPKPSSSVDDTGPYVFFSLYQRELHYRLGWMILVRWIVAAGMLVGVAYATLAMGAPDDAKRLLWLAVAVGAYNALFASLNRYSHHKLRPARWRNVAFALLQIFVDLGTFTVAVHWTGGVDSVLVVCYVFHLVFACVLLHRWACFVIALFAAMALDLVAYLEISGRLLYRPIQGFTFGYSEDLALTPEAHRTVLVCLLYNATFFLTVAAASSITKRLRQREREIEEMNHRLSEVVTAKSHFMRMAGHEMRSPLAAIQGLLQILSRRIAHVEADPACETLIERCQVRIASAHDLVNDLLEYSRIQAVSQQEPPENLDLAQVVREALEELAPIAEASEMQLTSNLSECMTLARRPQMLTLAKNLIGNALRYTLPEGEIEVTVGAEDGNACLRVADDGIGIEEIALGHVFDEFFRSPNAKEHEPAGTGLGLTMCRAIAETYGGSVSIISTPRTGTEVTVRLPLTGDPPVHPA